MDIKGSKPFFFTIMKANSAFSSQTRGWISIPKSSYIKHCCHFLCYRLLSVLKSIKRLNSIYLSGLAELLTWGDWRIFWFKLWTKANSFIYCTLIDISLRWFNRSWVVEQELKHVQAQSDRFFHTQWYFFRLSSYWLSFLNQAQGLSF